MTEATIAAIIAGLVTIVTMVTGFLTLWVKLKYAEIEANHAVLAAGKSQVVIAEVKELAVKTENQTNNRLSLLDAKVHSHELKCIESQKIAAEQARQIAELKLALIEAQMKVSGSLGHSGGD